MPQKPSRLDSSPPQFLNGPKSSVWLGLTLSSGDAQEKMDINLMREFVHQIQQEKTISTTVSQFRLVIDGVTKQINAKEMDVVFKNYSNIKRFYNPEASKNQLWAYGVTKYD